MERSDKAFVGLFTLTLMVVASLAVISPPLQRQIGLSGSLQTFQTYDQMKAYASQGQYSYRYGISSRLPMMAAAVDSAFAPSASTSYTTTNIQVQGVDEPDLVKTDGTYLYVVSGSSVAVIQTSGSGEMTLASRLKYDGQVLGVFIAQGRLVVIETEQRTVNGSYYWYSPTVNFMLYDDTNASSPALLKTVSVNGTYVDSRLTDGYVYAIVQQPSYEYVNGTTVFQTPAVSDGKVVTNIGPSDVYYSPLSKSSFGQYTIILSMSISDGSHSQEAVMTGWGSTVYASQSNIYLAFPDFYAYPMMGMMAPALVTGIGAPTFWRGFGGNTTVVRVAIGSAGQTQVEAQGMIPGTVLNQFSIDEYNGYLRVATTGYRQLTNQSYAQVSNVYVLNQGLSVVGAVENLAPTERIYSVRFMGDMGYVVTFKQVDPLFAISFADPTHPVQLSALELTGFSDYIHPIGNDLLLGVGKQTMPAAWEKGFVLYLGVKISLFHVAPNGTTSEVARVTIGDRGSDTPVSYDHHAFVYDSQDGIAALPILVAKADNSTYENGWPPYGTPVYQGAFFFRVSESGIQTIGSVTQIQNSSDVSQAQDFYINRIVIVGDVVYTISDRMVMASSLSGLSYIGSFKL